ncbi:MAG: DNA polymerase ligase N-terminal domain-containing protein [Candidatus Bathyarchaeia archaeon]
MPEESKPRFVVQFHKATQDHWDFRLEMDGVLKSWAVPKEPPTKPGIRRLAVQVEDHPLSYITFEGTIPEGQYGAGTVEIWDSGNYVLESRKPSKIVFRLEGKRMRGRYVLLQLSRGSGENWILFQAKEGGNS